jgi:PIN domain nuclease of toxin-antitoxin system
VILLDTHRWIWWVQGDKRLSQSDIDGIDACIDSGILVSVISCWETAMLSVRGRLELPCSLDDWLERALLYPGVQLQALTREIAVNACRLPGTIHRDPADQILIATARDLDCPLVTADERILSYPHVQAKLPTSLADT